MRHVYDCPICGAGWSVVELAGLTPGAGHPKVCPNGHRVTRRLKRARRRRQVQRAAEAAGLTEAEYRTQCRRRDTGEGGPLLWDFAVTYQILFYSLAEHPAPHITEPQTKVTSDDH